MLIAGHRFAGRYRLVRPLAQGGMGSVWVAHDTQLARDVALKVMTPAAFARPALVARFAREPRVAAQLQSAHAVQVFDHGLDDGQPFIVMELLEGEDLAVRLKRVGRLSIDTTARLVGDACKALRRAHELGIVHRDLKPANIFLARQDDEEVVKILDFGVAKLRGADAEMTSSDDVLGTPHYMAPEQTRNTGAPVDHRVDLWALAVIAFRALTGRLPFSGDNAVHVLVNVASQPVPSPSSIAPELGPEVDRFFATALARDPAARFQSAQALREALAQLASPAASDGRPSLPSGWEQVIAQEDTTIPRAAAPTALLGERSSRPLLQLSPSMHATQPLDRLAQRASSADAEAQRPLLPFVKQPIPYTQTLKLPAAQPPLVALEPTPAALSSTSAQGNGLRRSAPTGVHWVVFAAAGASIMVLALVLVTALTRSTDRHAAGAPVAAPQMPAPASSPADRADPVSSAAAVPSSSPSLSSAGSAAVAPASPAGSAVSSAQPLSSAPAKPGPAPTAVRSAANASVQAPAGVAGPAAPKPTGQQPAQPGPKKSDKLVDE